MSIDSSKAGAMLPAELKFKPTGLSLWDVLIVPPDTTSLLPQDVDTSVELGHGITLHTPILSAAMELFESAMAISLARHGALGVIHANLSPEDQVWEVRKVVRAEEGFLPNPHYVSPQDPVSEVYSLMKDHGIGGFPVVDPRTLRILGMITEKDVTRVVESNPDRPAAQVMTPHRKLVVAPFDTTVKEGLVLLKKKGVKKLPLVDKQGRLRGMIVQRDADRGLTHPNACRDESGRLRVAAAVFVAKDPQATVRRARALVKAGASAIVIDASVGWSAGVHEVTRLLRKALPNTCLISGNVVTGEEVKRLLDLGVDVIRVGYGLGSTCTSRGNLGTGVPQVTALTECASVAIPRGVPVLSDGGIEAEQYGLIPIALASGASAVMSGRLFAGCQEAPSSMQRLVDRKLHNVYRGMGSEGAMRQRAQTRYHVGVRVRTRIGEGVEGLVPVTTTVTTELSKASDALQRSMSLNNAKRIPVLWTRSLIPLTAAGQLETSQRVKKQ